jgi:hypothetical protein
VFYVDDDDNFLRFLTNKGDRDQETVRGGAKARRNYEDDVVSVGSSDVKSFTKDIAAISFPMATGLIRVGAHRQSDSIPWC